jgi:hypothetical protein
MSDLQFDSENQNPSGKSGGIGGTIFLILFAMPFAGFGLFAAVQGVRKLIAGNTHDGLPLCLFGLIFSLVGFGLMFGAVWGRKKLKQDAELKARFADKPWMMRQDWADGKIKSTSTVPVKFFLLWSFLAMALSAPAVWHIPQEWQKGNYAILIVLIFPAAAAGLLGYSFVQWRSQKRFGACFFEPAQIPTPLGGVLEGMIQTGKPLKLEYELNLKFSCIRRVISGSGKTRNVREYALWQTEKIYSEQAGLPQMEAGQTGIPVHFKLPADLPECYSRGNESVFWRLETKSKMRGPDFRAVFDLPVFKVAGATVSETDEAGANDPDPTAALEAPIEEIRRGENSRIKVSDGPNGREFYFPAARNPGMATFTTILFLAFSGGVYAMIANHFSIFFEMILGLFAVVFGCFTFSAWFKSSRVAIDFTGVRVTRHWLFFSRTRNFTAGEVERFETKVGMTSGNQAFQDIKLITNNSESTLASSIASAVEANWLVAEMNKALGRK